MSATSPSPAEIRDYILRRMTESRRAQMEELYFRDDGVLDRVEEAEDQIVSDYVLGRLSPEDRKTFEESLLSTPYYRDRIETTARLRLRLAQHDALRKGARPALPSRSVPGRTGLVVALAFVSVLFLAALASALQLKRNLEGATRLLAAGAGASAGADRVVLLAPPGPGGTVVSRVVRPAAVPLLLVLPRSALPDGTRSFRLALRTGGRIAWESGALAVGGPGDGDLSVPLPAGVPPAGRYEVEVAASGTGPFPEPAAAILEIAEPAR